MARRSPFSLPIPDATRARIDALTELLAGKAAAQGFAPPSLAHVARQALEIGLLALEKRNATTAPKRTK